MSATQRYSWFGNSVCGTPEDDKRLDEAYEAMSDACDQIVAELDSLIEAYALVYGVDKDELFNAVVEDKLFVNPPKRGEHQAQGLLDLVQQSA